MRTIMRVQKKTALMFCVVILLFFTVAIQYWTPRNAALVNSRRNDFKVEKVIKNNLNQLQDSYSSIPYRITNTSLVNALYRNGCMCEGDQWRINVPFADLLFPRVWATNLHAAFKTSELQDVKKRRQKEYSQFLNRTRSAADLLIVAEANSPLQYPTQGVAVQPKKSILIPGLGLKLKSRSVYSINLTAVMGTFDVAAEVDGVKVNVKGEKHLNISSSQLAALNRQLQFVIYTNTIFHPNTVDIVQFGTRGFLAAFPIKIRHEIPPKLHDTGNKKEYNISALVTIATKTFLRYDKLKDLIDSVRQFYPTVTIIIADDNEHPKLINEPYIEHYTMPYKKGWFAGRNLAVSQVTTKYVLWADDDFIFTSNTKLEKMVEVLESTTLDLVGGAVREVTGYTATYRHTISTEAGGKDGNCMHIRRGFHHVLDGFPNCVVTDAVINFFMARTDKVRQVGFDPRLARVAHIEFFVDGLGSLHVGSCDDVIVNHASKIPQLLPWGQTETDKAYSKFRQDRSSNIQSILFYFKNRFKCLTSN